MLIGDFHAIIRLWHYDEEKTGKKNYFSLDYMNGWFKKQSKNIKL